MLLLIDENVPDSSTAFLRERGHDVRLVREMLPRGAPDQIVALVGDQLGAVIVTWNHKHFQSLAPRAPHGTHQRFRRLGRISFLCKETRGRRRMEQFFELIEFEYTLAQRRHDPRLIVEVTENALVVVR